eukprot:4257449-Amphidinium_carterae.1
MGTGDPVTPNGGLPVVQAVETLPRDFWLKKSCPQWPRIHHIGDIEATVSLDSQGSSLLKCSLCGYTV